MLSERIRRKLEGKLIATRRMWPQKLYLHLLYMLRTGHRLHLRHPRNYNEKLQWMKLYYHNPQMVDMVDKVKAKDYVRQVIGEQYIIPTLGVWCSADEVDFDSLPDQFVIKCNHNSCDGLYICRDKSRLDPAWVRQRLQKALDVDYSEVFLEWPYKNVERRILAEQLLVNDDPEDTELHDYKFYCFDGRVQIVLVSSDRSKGDVKFDYFDRDFNHLPFTQGAENFPGEIKKPDNYDLMLELAEKLSAGFPHVRVDFYDVNGRVYFGELTFFDSSGYAEFTPEEWNTRWGDFLKLPAEKLI